MPATSSTSASDETKTKWDPYKEDKELGKRMELAFLRFRCGCAAELVPDLAECKKTILARAAADSMAPFYEAVCAQFGWDVDAALVAEMKGKNAAAVKDLDATYEDALENEGEQEILDAALAKADYLSKIWDTKGMKAGYDLALEKAISSGQRIDVVLAMIRNGLMHKDLGHVKDLVVKATKLVEKGGDWDRRNRLKVYEGCYCLAIRDFKKAAELFLSSIATFTCFELLDFKIFVLYTVLTCMLALDRPTLRDKVVNNPEILVVVREIPHLEQFLNAFFDCKYRDFMTALVGLHPRIATDFFCAEHVTYFVREFRIKAYQQFLQSYRSVTLDSMATSFGVTVPFLDGELSRFIAVKRLSAKIDKVGGIIVTNRSDAKNSQYQDVVKHGDQLLNRISKLARVIKV